MEEIKIEQQEALKALVKYSPKLLKAMREVIPELEGERKPDTDGYLLNIIKGMNWELQIINRTLDYINEEEQKIDKAQINEELMEFNKTYKVRDDTKLAVLMRRKIILLFGEIEKAAEERINSAE